MQAIEARIEDSARAQGFGVVAGLVWAFRIHQDGSAESLPVDQPIESRRDSWLWLHLNLANSRAADWIKGAQLPPHAADVLLSRDTRQQLRCTDGCVLGVFPDLVRHIAPGDDIAYLRFFMTERFLVSGRHQALGSVTSARDVLERGARRLPNVAALLELIVEHAGDAMDHLAEELATSIDQIEDRLALRNHEVERQNLARVRRAAVKLHRQLSGLRALFHRLERQGMEDLTPALRIGAGRLAGRLDAIDHTVVEVRDHARLLQEEITALTEEVTNRRLYVLSILTTLFLPPTLITGVFGMNVKGLPLGDNDDAFLWVSAVMIASAIAVYLLVRRVGVFRL